MRGTLDLERRLATWLEQDGPADVPAAVVASALAEARTLRQRPARLTRSWWDRRPLVAASAGVEAGAIEPDDRIATFPVARSPVRLAWVVVLLAALLAALVGGTLLVGSQVQRRLPAVVPPVGHLFECPPGSLPDSPGPVDQARPTEPSARAFDRRAGRLVTLARTNGGGETWTFDVCTNTWARMHPNREPPRFEWAQLVYDIDSDATILVSIDWATPGRVWAYDLQADTWTEMGVAPNGNALFLAYDPMSGLVVAADYSDRRGLWNYDVESDVWTPILQANAGPESPVIAYDASVDRIVAYSDRESPGKMWLFDLRTGRWSRSGADAPDVIEVVWAAPGIAYDEAAQRTVVIGDVRSAAYDATTDRWKILAEADPDRAEGFPAPSVYDPVNERLIGWRRFATVDQGELFAFDLATREWTVLLAPTETPGPSSE